MGLFKKLKKLANPVNVIKKTDPIGKKVLGSKIGQTAAKLSGDPMLRKAVKSAAPKPAARPAPPTPAARTMSGLATPKVAPKPFGRGRRNTY